MTSEVCVMNRLAVVLAADSATTVTSWGDEGREERYFKGANKIYQVSSHHPVGLMIYDSAEIMKVPWEIVIKSFRSHLGTKVFNDVSGYADEFFSFLGSSSRIFPESVQKEVFISAARGAIIQAIMQVVRHDATEAENLAVTDDAISVKRKDLNAKPFVDGIDQSSEDDIKSRWRDDIIVELRSFFTGPMLPCPSDPAAAADYAIEAILRTPEAFLGTTGLVFAGFGDNDIFPTMVQFISVGVIAGKHVARKLSSVAIDYDTPAWLSAFAQTSMSDTFALGLSEDIYMSVMQALNENLQTFAEEVIASSGGDVSKVGDLKALIAKASDGISGSMLDRAQKGHAFPMRRVLSALPVDEMAELAETLINLQSLKEKVTKPSETVGGPVDVAIITKHEGLVWIKRKHFFDPTLNSRYMQRQAAAYK